MAIYDHKEMCEYEECRRYAKYALYRLMLGGNKVWGHYCRQHEEEIARENDQLKAEFPRLVFTEDYSVQKTGAVPAGVK